MLQIRSILDVADNTGAKRAAMIGVQGRNQTYARVGEVLGHRTVDIDGSGTPEETLELFAYMEAAHQSKARGGAPVKLTEVLDEARKVVASRGKE